jgi:hypothetical protein
VTDESTGRVMSAKRQGRMTLSGLTLTQCTHGFCGDGAVFVFVVLGE